MISLLNAPTSTAKCMHLCVCVHAKSNKQPLDDHSQRRVCQSLFKLRPKSVRGEGGIPALFSLYTSLDVHTDTHRNNAAPLCGNLTGAPRRQPAYETVIIALRLHVDESVLLADVFFLTLMLLFFSLSPSLLSIRLHPPPCAGGSGKPGEGPPLFH